MEKDIKSNKAHATQFLSGGGETGESIRSKDWSATPMGEPETWPPGLKTIVSSCLNAPVPMSIFWGDELIMLYNDSFKQLTGIEQSNPFGPASNELSTEAWNFVRPFIEDVMHTGKAASIENDGGLLKRYGYGEAYHFTLSFSAIFDEHGSTAGVLVIVKEATSRALNESRDLQEKVRQTEDRYRTLFNSIDAGFCTIEVKFDNHGKPVNYSFLEVNKAFEQQTGLHNAAGKSMNDFVQLEDFWYETYGSVAVTGEPVRFENVAENLHRFYDVYAFKIGTPDERKVGVLFTDISARKKAEQGQALANKAVEESEARFRNLLQEAPVAATLFRGSDFVIEIANELTLKYWGKSRDIIGKPVTEAASELQDQGLLAQLRDLYRQGGTAHYSEVPITFVDKGELKEGYYTYSLKTLHDTKGNVDSILAIGIDVTEHVKARKLIEESQAQLAFAIDATELGVWDYNPITNKFRANSRLKEWFGLQPEEEIDLSLALAVIDEGDRERVATAIQQTLNEPGGDFDVEYTIINPKTAQKRFVRAKGKASFGEDMIAYRFNGTLQDVTVQTESRRRIEESEVNLRNMVLAAPIGMCVMDASTLISEIVNDSFVEIAGKPYDSIIGQKHWDTFAEARQYYEAALQGVVDTGIPFFANEVELMLIRHGKEEIVYVTFVYMPMKDTEGSVQKVVVWVLNNTLQVNERRKVEESENRFRTLIEEAPVATCLFVGKELKIEIANEKIIQIMGKGPSVLGKPLAEAVPELKGQPFLQQLDKVFETGFTYENRNARAELLVDGELKVSYVDYIFKPLKDVNGEVYAILDMTIDVTSHVLARMELQESEEKFRLLSNEMPQFVWTGDAQGNLNYFNKAVYQYSGLSVEDTKNGGWIQIVHPEDREENIRLWQHSVTTGEDFIYEHRFRRADGEYRWQLSRAIPQRDAQGVIQQWIGTSTDIQDQKNVEEKLEKLVSERTQELQRSNEDLQQFAHVASHDLKEPVRKIKTYLGRLAGEYGTSLPPRGQEFVQKMESATSRIYNMIDGVLLYSSVDGFNGNVQTVSLNQIIEDVLDDTEIAIEQKGAQIQYGTLPDLQGIPVLLYQLFYNLVNNALKFSRTDVDPVIIIQATPLDKSEVDNLGLLPVHDYVRVLLKDNGIGFEQTYAEEIFKTFKRLNSKDKFEGTGLGLALCKKIVERHGGLISATGEPGIGATFSVILPC